MQGCVVFAKVHTANGRFTARKFVVMVASLIIRGRPVEVLDSPSIR